MGAGVQLRVTFGGEAEWDLRGSTEAVHVGNSLLLKWAMGTLCSPFSLHLNYFINKST